MMFKFVFKQRFMIYRKNRIALVKLVAREVDIIKYKNRVLDHCIKIHTVPACNCSIGKVKMRVKVSEICLLLR